MNQIVPELVKIDKIKPNPENPRFIKDKKFAELVKSIKDFPRMLWLRPLVVNDKMILLGGNMRHKACLEAGLTEVPVIKAADLSPEQEKEFIIKDNLGYGEWNWDVLANEWDQNLLTEWGLDIPDFPKDPNEPSDDDYIPPIEIKTDFVIGDLFEIGPHRLLCGDSTNPDHMARLLGGKKPYIMVTDPPYGVNYDPKWRLEAGVNKPWQTRAEGKVMNDDRADWSEVWALVPAKVCYVWHGALHSRVVAESLEANNFLIRSQIIWAKPSLVMGRGDYHWQHEPCWYAVKKGAKGMWAGDRKQATIWNIQNMHRTKGNVDDGKTMHSTQKPVECMSRAIQNHEGDVIDPFCGSGTTLVACHQLKRNCYAMELNPQYVQIIVDRMKALDPNIKILKNGEIY